MYTRSWTKAGGQAHQRRVARVKAIRKLLAHLNALRAVRRDGYTLNVVAAAPAANPSEITHRERDRLNAGGSVPLMNDDYHGLQPAATDSPPTRSAGPKGQPCAICSQFHVPTASNPNFCSRCVASIDAAQQPTKRG